MATLTVVAGPNGSGKSTLTRGAREAFQDIPILDPDALSRVLRVTSTDAGSEMDAGREQLQRAAALLSEGQSFLVETKLSGHTYLRMMREAKSLGYLVRLFFVGTSSVEINLERVRNRVRRGGHDVPEEDQRRRFPRAMANLPKAFALADEAAIFDNSGSSHVCVAIKDDTEITIFKALSDWAAFLHHG